MNRRVKVVRLDDSVFTDMLTAGNMYRVLAGVPHGAKLLGADKDILTRQWVVSFEHPSFPEHVEGERATEQPVIYEAWRAL